MSSEQQTPDVCVCPPPIRTLIPMGQAAVDFHPAVVSLTLGNTLLDRPALSHHHCHSRWHQPAWGFGGGSLL